MEISNREELKSALQQIIEKQLQDAAKRRDDPSFWEGTSKNVTAAAWSARNAIERSIDDAIVQNSLTPVLDEVRRAYHQFNDFFENDDGSGAGTFADILREIESIETRDEAERDE